MTKINNNYKKECKMFEELIKRGKILKKKAPSIRGFDLNKIHKTEKEGFKWFIETRNFLISLFGKGFRDVKTFTKCFKKYSSMNLLGQYSGDHIFIKEDISKAIGVLEGIYYSYKLGKIKKRNYFMILLSKSNHELQEWISIIIKAIRGL